jgi:hypothetical protein
MTARAHARYHGLNAAQSTEKVRFHDLAEGPYWHLFHRSSTTTYASVIHENVNATVLCKHLIDRIGYGTVVIHIEHGYGHRKPFGRDDLPKFSATIQISHRRNYFVAATCERHGGCQSDAATGAGNQCDGHVCLPGTLR